LFPNIRRLIGIAFSTKKRIVSGVKIIRNA